MSDVSKSKRKYFQPPDYHSHHLHGTIDPSVFTTSRGIWAIKWSFAVLILTVLFQSVVFHHSGSVALLAEILHNLGDAGTAVPLWVAFALSQRKPTPRFTYGYGRVEDLAGLAIVLLILSSAVAALNISINRFLHPLEIQRYWAVILAGVIGFIGNEGVAIFRIRIGNEIKSAALIADGYHARIDGWTSLTVVIGAIGTRIGHPLTDPLMGLFITVVILGIAWKSGKAVLTRMLDGVDPAIVDEIRQIVKETRGVLAVSEVRVRWLGHQLHAEVNIAVLDSLSVESGHRIAIKARDQLLQGLTYLSNAIIHVDPIKESGEDHHRIDQHDHGGLSSHSD